MTGPTYPKKETVTLNGKQYNLKLLRSHGGNDDADIILNIGDKSVKANLFWKPYPPVAEDDWTKVTFTNAQKDGKSVKQAKLPHQPPAGKLMYYIALTDRNETKYLNKENPVIIRFKGKVPAYILIPHIIFMFAAMFLANVSGLFAAFNMPQYKRYTGITLLLITAGGMILGPAVQKYAFLEYWAGVPYGWDLTDNKLLIAFIAWFIAFLINRKKENRMSVITASLITIIIFSIPHSMFGSELNRETGKIIQGIVLFF